MRARPRNFHLPLPEPLHQRLHSTAARIGAPATAVARQAIECWLEEHERSAVHESLVEYARSMAGSRGDLDEELEEAAVEHLLDKKQKRRK